MADLHRGRAYATMQREGTQKRHARCSASQNTSKAPDIPNLRTLCPGPNCKAKQVKNVNMAKDRQTSQPERRHKRSQSFQYAFSIPRHTRACRLSFWGRSALACPLMHVGAAGGHGILKPQFPPLVGISCCPREVGLQMHLMLIW